MMKLQLFPLYRLMVVAMLMLLAHKLQATHIMAGDITYKYLGKDSFLVKMNLYRDCNGVYLTHGLISTWLSGCGTKKKKADLSFVSVNEVTPICASADSRCSKPSSTIKYGVQQFVYSGIVKLDTSFAKCCQIKIAFEYCCRNSAITTGAADKDFYIEAMLDRCVKGGNSSPQFSSPITEIICIGRDFRYSHGASDPDKDQYGNNLDSFVYSWADPLESPTKKTPWTHPFSSQKPIRFFGWPHVDKALPRGFHLDSSSGDLAFLPIQVQSTVMAIKVEEFRQGKKIGQVRRDLQLVVITCPNNTPPIISGFSCQDPSYDHFNIKVCANSDNKRPICTFDKDTSDSISLSWDGQLSSLGASFKQDSTARGRAFFDWKPDSGLISKEPYKFRVTAVDNACPFYGEFTKTFRVTVVSNSWDYSYSKGKPSPCGVIKASVKDHDTVAGIWKVRWYVDESLVDSGFDFSYQMNMAKRKRKLRIELLDSNRCREVIEDSLVIDSIWGTRLNAVSDTLLCLDSTALFIPSIADSAGPLGLVWHIAKGTSITIDSSRNLRLPVDRDAIISLTATDTYGCSSSVSFKARATSRLKPGISLGGIYACANTDSFVLPEDKQHQSCWVSDELTIKNGVASIPPFKTGEYKITLMLKDDSVSGCSYGYDTVIKVESNYILSAVPNAVYCNDGKSKRRFFDPVPDFAEYSGWKVKFLQGRGRHYIDEQDARVNRNEPYILHLKAGNSKRCVVPDTAYIMIGRNPEISGFQASKTSGAPPLSTSFTASVAFDNASRYLWNFGDGRSSSSKAPARIYGKGFFGVSLMVKDSFSGCFDTLSQPGLMSVRAQVHIHSLKATPDTVIKDKVTQIQADMEVSDSDVVYQWVVDGNPVSSGTKTLSWRPGAKGWYSVGLKARDTVSLTQDSIFVDSLILAYVPVKADFSATPLSGKAPLKAQFSNTSTGDENDLVWEWKQNGSIFSVAKNPKQTFAEGKYSITLRVTDRITRISDELTKEAYIQANKLANGVDLAMRIGLAIYPNPASESFVVRMSQPEKGMLLTLYSSDGRLMRSVPVQEARTMVKTESLPRGLLSYRLSWPDGRQIAGRVVLE